MKEMEKPNMIHNRPPFTMLHVKLSENLPQIISLQSFFLKQEQTESKGKRELPFDFGVSSPSNEFSRMRFCQLQAV